MKGTVESSYRRLGERVHMHFWPYGLKYDTEAKSDEDMIRHAKLVEAMVKDLEEAKRRVRACSP